MKKSERKDAILNILSIRDEEELGGYIPCSTVYIAEHLGISISRVRVLLKEMLTPIKLPYGTGLGQGVTRIREVTGKNKRKVVGMHTGNWRHGKTESIDARTKFYQLKQELSTVEKWKRDLAYCYEGIEKSILKVNIAESKVKKEKSKQKQLITQLRNIKMQMKKDDPVLYSVYFEE